MARSRQGRSVGLAGFARRIVAFDVETVPRLLLSELPPREQDRFRRAAEDEARRAAGPRELDPQAVDLALGKAFSLHPLTCRIVSLALCSPERETVLVAAPGAELEPPALAMEERDLLAGFWRVARSARLLVGFNSLRFDLPVLLGRSALLDVPVSADLLDGAAGRRARHLDLLAAMEAGGRRLSLELAAWAFAIPVKSEGHGSEVAGMVAAGRFADLVRYNLEDARATLALHRKLRGKYF